MSQSAKETSWTELVPSWAGVALAENAIGPVICLDHHLRFLYLNPEAEQVLGTSSASLLGNKFPGPATNEFYSRCETLARSVLENGHEERVELALEDGARFYWCRVAPEPAPDGSTNIVVIAREITDAKRTSVALGESSARVRSIMAAIPDMVFRISSDGTLQEFIPGVAVSPLADPAAFIGMKVADVEFDWPAAFLGGQAMRLVEETLRTGAVQTVEYSATVGGEVVYREARFAPFTEDQVIAVVRDITVQKRAELGLVASEARWRTLVETVPALITTTDLDGRIEYLNNPLPPMTRDSVVGTSAFDYLNPADEGQVRQMMERVISQRATEILETSGPDDRWYESHIAPIVSGDEVTGLIIVSIDITERRRLEQELAAARDEVEDRIEAAAVAPNEYGLSFRELTVLVLVAEGKSDKEIAAVLGLRPRTVSKHMEKILRKMQCGSRTEAGVRAIREKLLP